MTPALRYAQAIQGRVTGRGTGIIDTIHLVEVVRALEQLEGTRGWSPRRRGGHEALVRRLPRVADDRQVRHRRARHDQQSCDVLGDAGGAFAHYTGNRR